MKARRHGWLFPIPWKDIVILHLAALNDRILLSSSSDWQRSRKKADQGTARLQLAIHLAKTPGNNPPTARANLELQPHPTSLQDAIGSILSLGKNKNKKRRFEAKGQKDETPKFIAFDEDRIEKLTKYGKKARQPFESTGTGKKREIVPENKQLD